MSIFCHRQFINGEVIIIIIIIILYRRPFIDKQVSVFVKWLFRDLL